MARCPRLLRKIRGYGDQVQRGETTARARPLRSSGLGSHGPRVDLREKTARKNQNANGCKQQSHRLLDTYTRVVPDVMWLAKIEGVSQPLQATVRHRETPEARAREKSAGASVT